MRQVLMTVFVVSLLTVVNSASAIDIFDVEGVWENPVGGTNITFTTGAGNWVDGIEPEKRILWGTEFEGGGQSGLGFTDRAPLANVEDSGPFALGQLRHFNNPIVFGTHATAVDLTIGINFVNPANFQQFTLTMQIDETLNAPVPQADIIDFPSDLFSTEFLVDNTTYRLQILGFGPDAGSIQEQFVSPEGTTNTTYLWAEITSVPIPAPGAVLLGGIGTALVGLLRRRRVV